MPPSRGAQQAAELQASASAAIAKAASNAATGAVTADAGEVEVDLGPTRHVSENSTGKASGGGQPSLNYETQSQKLARTNVGGAPNVTLAVAETAKMAEAPPGEGGGEPPAPEANPEATAVVRTESGGSSPQTGGPASVSSEPTAESASAQEVAEAEIGRAEPVQAAQAAPAAGGGTKSPARSATGPTLIANLSAEATPAGAANPPQGSPDGSPPAPSQIEVARVQASGGAPTSGGPATAEAAGPPEEEADEEGSAAGAVAVAQIGRAESVESTVGTPSAGGGTASPTRQATGPAFAVNAAAKTVEVALAGNPNSSGARDGSPIEAQGADAAKMAAGVAGKAAGELAGAMAAADVMDAPLTGSPGDTPGGRRASPAGTDGPAVGNVAASGGSIGKRSAEISLPSGMAAQVAMADVGGGSPTSELDADSMISGMDSTGMDRQAAVGGLPVDVSAPEGPGGLGTEVALDAGTMNRRAQEESQEVHFRPARFIRTQTGGPLSINLTAAMGTKAFSGRSKFKNQDLAGGGGSGTPPPKTEKSIELGLRFLVNHQSNDGSWSLGNFGAGRRGYEGERTALTTDTGATGLCLLAFLGAGYHHREDRYQEVVQNALDYIIKNQKEDGNVFIDQDPQSSRAVWFYSHSIVTIALCEAYGMTQDPDLREPAQKALNFLVESQHPDRGGWRYSPRYGSDTSVTGWAMMALKSGQLAGLEVPKESLDGIDNWLDMAQAGRAIPHLYVYNPLAPDTPQQRHGREASPTMTAVGLLMRLYSGWDRNDPRMIRGGRYLLENLPTNGTRQDPQRDTYYWYYATQVMFHMGGKYWEEWNEKLHPLLVDEQLESGPMAGSWDPRRPVADRWAPHAGRIYVTTLNLLSLEVYYRHLPIYEDTAK